MYHTLDKIYRFYLYGFKSMTVGKTLWVIMIIKVAIIFFVLKLFFFKYELSDYQTPEAKSKHVVEQLTKESAALREPSEIGDQNLL